MISFEKKCTDDNSRIKIDYDDIVPFRQFSKIIKDIASIYIYSIKKPKYITNISKYSAELLRSYYMAQSISANFLTLESESKESMWAVDASKCAVALSSGKDSVHLLLQLLKEYKRDDIYCYYVKNLNKSESAYEIKDSKKICEHLGVNFKAINIVNSVKYNRNNHNIGLREQFIAALMLPYMEHHNIGKFYFGHHGQYEAGPLWSVSPIAWELFSKYLENEYGIDVEYNPHKLGGEIGEEGIIKDLVQNNRDILDMCSSCYCQMNFREKWHKVNQKNFPNIQLYKGCGNCLKCCRINAGIVLWGNDIEDSKPIKKFLTRKQKYRFPDDKTLKIIVDQF